MNKNASKPRVLLSPVKLARLRMGITQGELAKRVGVHHGYMSQMERAPSMMTPEVAARVAKALGLKVEELSK